MDYPRLTTSDGGTFLLISFSPTLEDDDFVGLVKILREAGAHFDSERRAWLLPEEQGSYFEGLLGGLSARPHFVTSTSTKHDRDHDRSAENMRYSERAPDSHI